MSGALRFNRVTRVTFNLSAQPFRALPRQLQHSIAHFCFCVALFTLNYWLVSITEDDSSSFMFRNPISTWVSVVDEMPNKACS